jgi:hypothetical protein
MRKTVAPVGMMKSLRHVAEQASTFQKIAGAIVVGVGLLGLLVTGINNYAPWAWAGDVERRQNAIESKLDILSTAVLEAQLEDAEAKIGVLDAKGRTKVGLTDVEAEVLRAKKRRVNQLNDQLKAISAPQPKK